MDVDYLYETDKLEFIDGAIEALALLKEHGYRLIVISNQSGIGEGNFGCRKPRTGLIDRAAAEWGIDLSCSYMVGDTETDVMTAIHSGCRYGLVLSGHAVPEMVRQKYKAHLYQNLWDFARRICEVE